MGVVDIVSVRTVMGCVMCGHCFSADCHGVCGVVDIPPVQEDCVSCLWTGCGPLASADHLVTVPLLLLHESAAAKHLCAGTRLVHFAHFLSLKWLLSSVFAFAPGQY